MYFRLRLFRLEVVEILTRSPEDVVREFIESLEAEDLEDDDDESVHDGRAGAEIDGEADDPLELLDRGPEVFNGFGFG